MTIKKYILFSLCKILFVTILISCGRGKKDLLDEGEIPEHFYRTTDSINKADPLHNIVSGIANYGSVDAKYTGFAGVTSDQYERYELLLANASDSQLVLLTDHQNSNVKVYAFYGLVERKYSHIKQIFDKHLYDRQTYSSFGGCIVSEKHINVSFLLELKNKLSKKEFGLYKEKILNSYSKEERDLIDRMEFFSF